MQGLRYGGAPKTVRGLWRTGKQRVGSATSYPKNP